jgi:hypothetical protein
MLSGWNPNQILTLTIDGSKIDEELTDFPINITLSANTGINGFDATDVFDKLSYDNRTKLVVTDSDDNKLYTEIAYWDAINKEASLWTRIPTISSGTNKQLFLYYDANTSGSGTRTLAEASDDFNGTNGDPPKDTIWKTASSGDFVLEIQNNTLNFDPSDQLNHINYLDTRYSISGDFDIQISFDVNSESEPDDGANWLPLIGVHIDSVRVAYIGRATIGANPQYGSAGNDASFVSYNTSDTSGKLRLTRDSGQIRAFQWDSGQSRWEWDDSTAGRLLATDSNDAIIRIQLEQEDNGNVDVDISDFIINSAASITGFVGDTGTIPAQNVWDSNFKLVCHLDSNLLDSTNRKNNGTNTGADDVAGKIGDAKRFPDTADRVTFPTNSYSTTNTYTIETLVKPTTETGVHLWEGSALSSPSIEGASNNLNFWVGNSSNINTGTLTTGIWYYLAAKYDKANTKQSLWMNDSEVDNNTVDVSDTLGSSFPLGNRILSGTGQYSRNYGGSVDELRISIVVRSDAWLKATYYSNWNTLLNYTHNPNASYISGKRQRVLVGGQWKYISKITYSDSGQEKRVDKLIVR